LEGDRSILGRHPDCDIVLDVGAVSRHHAQVVRVEDDFFVEDLGSRNGTFVNGELIEGRYRLQDNDRVKICDLLFTFHPQPPTHETDSSTSATPDATVVVEDDVDTTNSTIMSVLDVSTSDSALRVTIKPEAKLRALLEITESLGRTLSQEEVFPKTLDTLFKIFVQADRGFIVLRDQETNQLATKAVKHRRADMEEAIRISRTIVNQALDSREAILSADATSDSRFDMSQSIVDFHIRSMICAPMIDSEGHALGVIQLDTMDQKARFQQDDLELLASVARQAAFALENAWLHEHLLDQQALERDLHLAHRVQQGFLPDSAPVVEGYEFFDFYEAANQLGGDYYDYIELPGNRLAVVVADVAGKGVPAALVMAKLSAEIKYCLASEADPAAAINRVNTSFANSVADDRFVTLVLGMINLNDGSVVIVNAGHMPPLLRHSDQRVEPIGDDEAGLPLGIEADYIYEKTSIMLGPGESLVMYTDGLSEAMNPGDELFGLERLELEVAADATGVADLGRRILASVKRFAGDRAQSDDMCLSCFGRLPA
jgi:serine phosphatase RsbU (regulator of sigma subunit)/pSer/pThr/pTyr-binding forkhead associated (FHA) protein